MMKIKILQMVCTYDDEGNRELKDKIGEGCTDWEDVDDATYGRVRDWVIKKNNRYSNTKYILAIDSGITVANTVDDYLKMIEADKDKEREEKAKAAKRKKGEAQRKKASDLKKLAKLKEKYGE
jgi:hypothetical protein